MGFALRPLGPPRDLGDGLQAIPCHGTNGRRCRIFARQIRSSSERPVPDGILDAFRQERRLSYGQKGGARIARPIEARQSDDRMALLLAWEWVEGPTLRDYLYEVRTLPPEDCVRLALGLLASLDHLHQQDFLHGDLSPDNVVLHRAMIDRPWLLDLEGGCRKGLSRRGKPGYEPPEQREGRPLTPAADLWSLGRVLQLCSTGETAPPESIPDEGGSLSRWIRRCLAANPADRPAARALSREIRSWLESRARARPALPGFSKAVRVREPRIVTDARDLPVSGAPDGNADWRKLGIYVPDGVLERLGRAGLTKGGRDDLFLERLGDEIAQASGDGRLVALAGPNAEGETTAQLLTDSLLLTLGVKNLDRGESIFVLLNAGRRRREDFPRFYQWGVHVSVSEVLLYLRGMRFQDYRAARKMASLAEAAPGQPRSTGKGRSQAASEWRRQMLRCLDLIEQAEESGLQEVRYDAWRAAFPGKPGHEPEYEFRLLRPSRMEAGNLVQVVDPVYDVAIVEGVMTGEVPPWFRVRLRGPAGSEAIPQYGAIRPAPSLAPARCRRRAVHRLAEGEAANRTFLPAWLERRFDPLLPGDVQPLNPSIGRNPRQREALVKALATPDLLLIQGPPGTGKTTVITEIVEHFVRRGQRVLLSSSSNQAVDNVFKGIHKEGPREDLLTVRLGDENKVRDPRVAGFLREPYAEWLQVMLRRRAEASRGRIEFSSAGESDLSAVLPQLDRLCEALRECRETACRSEEEMEDLQRRIPATRERRIADALYRTRDRRRSFLDGVAKAEKRLSRAWRILRGFWRWVLERRRRKASRAEADQLRWEGELEAVSAERRDLENRIDERALLLSEHRGEARRLGKEVFALIGPWAAGIEREIEDLVSRADARGLVRFLKGREKRRQERLRLVRDWCGHLGAPRPEIIAALLRETNVVGATCIGSATDPHFGPAEFDYDVVILDEAGQISLFDSLVPLSRGRVAILVGDHKQLPPVVDDGIEEEAKKAGLDPGLFTKSIFELAFERLPADRVVRLNTQFRMPAVIADFVGECFYAKDYFSPVDRPPLLEDFPQFLLLDTVSYGPERREQIAPGKSRINPLEARLAVRMAMTLLERGRSPNDIGIIAPYSAQAAAIERLLRERLGPAPAPIPKVSTVDAFQGGEKDFIIATCVRSNPDRKAGFIRELRRFNVTVTRSKGHLFVIGDFDHLVNVDHAETAEFFRMLVAYVKRREAEGVPGVRKADARAFLGVE